jgi:hypothetical protein
MVKFRNLISKRMEWTRISVESGSYIPIPEKFDAFKDQKAGEWDTDAKLVNEVTWTPNLMECPFPTPLMNQLERLRRIGKEGKAI